MKIYKIILKYIQICKKNRKMADARPPPYRPAAVPPRGHFSDFFLQNCIYVYIILYIFMYFYIFI